MQFPVNVYAVVDLGFGDNGKGATVDYICSQALSPHVIRYSGGPQCSHAVVDHNSGRTHLFSMFGSGTFRRAPTYIHHTTLVDPIKICWEADDLEATFNLPNPCDLLTVHARCPVITIYHRALNYVMSAEGSTTGHGVGALRQSQFDGCPVLRANTPREKIASVLHDILEWVKHVCHNSGEYDMSWLNTPFYSPANVLKTTLNAFDRLRYEGCVSDHDNWLDHTLPVASLVFEGAQGVLLDQHFGPGSTQSWTDVTLTNVDQCLADLACMALNPLEIKSRFNIGVTRTYSVRHGAGAFPTHEPDSKLEDPNNPVNRWQGKLRFGPLDLVLLKYATDPRVIGAPLDVLAVNHCDQFPDPTTGLTRICKHYNCTAQGKPGWKLADLAETVLNWTPKTYLQSKPATRLLEWLLTHSTPVIEQCNGLEALLMAIGAAASSTDKPVPVAITGYGPAAKDRQLLMPELFSD